MAKDTQYRRGYAAGYADGIWDAQLNKVKSASEQEIGDFPVKGMAISSRAINCLISAGCRNISDVASLNSYKIASLRNVGRKTAGEIAAWLIGNGILDTAWSEFL